MARENKKLLVYSQDGFGLGHQRRTSRIVEQVMRQVPYFFAVTICDSPLGQIFQSSPSHTYVNIPTIVKNNSGVWSTLDKSDLSSAISSRRKMIEATIDSFSPDIFLVDHMPQGALGELQPIIPKVKRAGCKIVLGLRDILDSPETIVTRWHKEDAYTILRNYYDHVLIYGEKKLFDARTAYQIPSSLATTYCGYVSPLEHNASDKLAGKDLYGDINQDVKRVLVSFGGGADAAVLLRVIQKALHLVSKQYSIVTKIITGPFNPVRIKRRIKLGITDTKLIRNTDQMLSYMMTADLAISMAGYNTIAEVLHLQTRALIIPRRGPSMEQQMRASCLGKAGHLDSFLDKNMNPTVISDRISTLLTIPLIHQERNTVNLNGASNAASILTNL